MAKKTITTSIAYINAEPHIGFLLELVAADVLARYYRLQGDEVFFLTGTDEHGIKVQKAAEAASKKPQEYADEVSAKFQKLCQEFSISNDYFIRTSDKKHVDFVSNAWKQLAEADVIEKRRYEGKYCSGCEAFKTEREIIDGKCSIHEVPVEDVAEDNYFLRLTNETKNAIREWLKAIEPVTKQAEVSNILDDFEGVSISRPQEKLSWGIPVPGDDSQVMYVWVDALLNYLSGIEASGRNIEDYWPGLQIIGKDILKFHAIIWPSILIPLSKPLPDQLLVHGFVNVEGKKMSKSLGNVITPQQLKDRYGVEATRYLLLRQLNFYDDSNFVWSEFDAIYNGELANGIGNLTSRVVNLLKRFKESGVGFSVSESTNVESTLVNADYSTELEKINSLITSADEWISEVKPWEWAKQGKVSQDQVNNLLRQSNLIELSVRLEPFMPETAASIRQQLKNLEPKPLFPRVEG